MTPRPLWAETDPIIWWEATQQAIRSLLDGIDPSSVRSVGLTGQMHGMVALDEKGRVLRPCIMWNDQRSYEECAEITERIGESEVLRITGNPVLAGFTAPKVLWVQKNEPEAFARIDKILLPKDYIRYQMTGDFFTDAFPTRPARLLLSVGKRTWSDSLLDSLGWSRQWLPEVTESTEASAKVSTCGSEATGLPVGTPVIAEAGTAPLRRSAVPLFGRARFRLPWAPVEWCSPKAMSIGWNPRANYMLSVMPFRVSGI